MIRSIDIEEAARQALSQYYAAYITLPATYTLPFIRVTAVGGSQSNMIDSFRLVIEGYAKDDETACEVTRNAVGILRANMYAVRENSKAVAYSDPIRPDLCRYRTEVSITAHLENFTL